MPISSLHTRQTLRNTLANASKYQQPKSQKGLPRTRLFFDGWLDRFKRRNGLREIVFHGERVSVPQERIGVERVRLRIELRPYHPRDILNVDEMGLYWRMPPKRGTGKHESGGVKADKVRFTYVLCTNADGSEKLPAMIIGTAERPSFFPRHSKVSGFGFDYHNNKNAWMTMNLWNKFLTKLNERMRLQNLHVLLLCDNASSHKHDPADYPNVRVEYLAPNLTPWVQPMDFGVIYAFKSRYRKRFMQKAIERDEAGIANIYKINPRKTMEVAQAAWDAVTPTTIANCWRHSGILPHAPTTAPDPLPDPIEDVEDRLAPEFGLVPGYIHPDVGDMLSVLEEDVPTEQELTGEETFPQVSHSFSSSSR